MVVFQEEVPSENANPSKSKSNPSKSFCFANVAKVLTNVARFFASAKIFCNASFPVPSVKVGMTDMPIPLI